jgi:hypothetical protein
LTTTELQKSRTYSIILGFYLPQGSACTELLTASGTAQAGGSGRDALATLLLRFKQNNAG